ncbi:hypothetical protein B566_EDAN019001 [Ephemera danica]|nr:hypothetical protein B566_EDAN019001 [Ephemera danica]
MESHCTSASFATKLTSRCAISTLIKDIFTETVSVLHEPGLLLGELRWSTQDNNQQNASASQRDVTASKSYSFTCEVCDKSYNTASNLNAHKNNIHGQKAKPLQCSICKRMYKNDLSLRAHMFDLKGCLLVWFADVEPVAAVQHPLPAAVPPRKLFPCSMCSKKYTKQRNLERHTRNLHGKDAGPFLCDRFGSAFAGACTRTPEIWPCPYCVKVFSTKHNLLRHKKNLHGEDAVPTQCQFCARVYKNKDTLRTHIFQNHRDEQEYL